MNIDIPSVLAKLAARRDKTFQYRNKDLTLEEVFAFSGALPILVRKANLLADFLFGRKLQVSFVTEPGSLTGEKIVVLPEQSAFILVMLLHDVVEELVIATTGKVIALS
jgi:hypothetical protein